MLLDELADVLERTPSLGHVVLDEAQDLSAMQLRAVGRRCSTGSATVLDDLAQATTPWASRSWSTVVEHLGKSQAHLEELSQGFRVPAEVIEFAARLLPVIAPDLSPPSALRHARGELIVQRVASQPEMVDAALAAAGNALGQLGSVGLIIADAWVPKVRSALERSGFEAVLLGEPGDVDARLVLVPATLAKGLEFDHVVVAEPAEIVATEPDETTGLRRLYVCLTRAVTSLTVIHNQPLPDLLRP